MQHTTCFFRSCDLPKPPFKCNSVYKVFRCVFTLSTRNTNKCLQFKNLHKQVIWAEYNVFNIFLTLYHFIYIFCPTAFETTWSYIKKKKYLSYFTLKALATIYYFYYAEFYLCRNSASLQANYMFITKLSLCSLLTDSFMVIIYRYLLVHSLRALLTHSANASLG